GTGITTVLMLSNANELTICLSHQQPRLSDGLFILTKQNAPIQLMSFLSSRGLSDHSRIQLIRAKVPILKFRERGSYLEFDLNINNTVGIRNTFLLRSYAYADVRIRPMVLVVKKWARHNQINDASKGTLSSYTLVLMVLHYLQTLREPVLPSLQRAHPSSGIGVEVGRMGPCSFSLSCSSSRSSSLPANFFSPLESSVCPHLPASSSLVLCFWLSGNSSWDKQVISVRDATTLPKTNSQEWRNKFICVEGKHLCGPTHSVWVTAL
ncbi:hypothetical protein XENOCAPTIV_013979, partial [Xenoophorus captivus]